MNSRELELLEKKSLYCLRVCDDLKESVVQSYLNDLNKFVKFNTKKKLLLVVLEDKS
ncbi:hypothetical protein M2125_000358 [Polynucleobacter sphagniphilus]|nr:hypothetical protein [Polynucleobacter sphagniphilus]